ncbi:hypothetical protein D9M71_502490 [compost metagenome]
MPAAAHSPHDIEVMPHAVEWLITEWALIMEDCVVLEAYGHIGGDVPPPVGEAANLQVLTNTFWTERSIPHAEAFTLGNVLLS